MILVSQFTLGMSIIPMAFEEPVGNASSVSTSPGEVHFGGSSHSSMKAENWFQVHIVGVTAIKASFGRASSIAMSASQSRRLDSCGLRESRGGSVVAFRPGGADVRGRPGARVERGLVKREIEDPRVSVEDLLGSISVMYVPVHDVHSGRPLGKRVRRCNRHVVEEAEAHGLRGTSMEAGGRSNAIPRRGDP